MPPNAPRLPRERPVGRLRVRFRQGTELALQLGIDTGGPYTDAVLLDQDRRVVASAKALTTREDLSLGLRAAAAQVVAARGAEVGLVSTEPSRSSMRIRTKKAIESNRYAMPVKRHGPAATIFPRRSGRPYRMAKPG